MKIIRIVTLLSICLFCWNCKKENQNINFSQIILMDKFSNKLKVDFANKLTTSEISPLYIGKISENITISYQTRETVRKTETYKEYKLPIKNSLEIFVDTTRIIGIPMGIYEYSKEGKRNDKIANPIFIKNRSKDTLNIGYAEYLPIIIEAKNRNGKWQPIQERMRFMCGNGIIDFYCPPENIVISAMQKYGGNFKTKLRLKYESFGSKSSIYSNEINGKINEKQFVK
ncbi:MAG: hypothetical protein ABI549_13600 [Flavobacterium sp.]|uniref:hypothetical protein n=1 Tax=Flavobacterium sp. TaxID=239 RepID=UPI003265AC78